MRRHNSSMNYAAMHLSFRDSARNPAFTLALLGLVLLAGCGGGGGAGTTTATPPTPEQASVSTASVESTAEGATPFIDKIILSGTGLAAVDSVGFIVAPKPGATAKAVSVTYSIAALARQGYTTSSDTKLSFPVFGLYAGYTNTLNIRLGFKDGSSKTLPLNIKSSTYTDPTGIYSAPTVLVKRANDSALGFNYFFIKSSSGTPIVIDTDGEIRWVAKYLSGEFASAFKDGGFIVGSFNSGNVSRLELDGTLSTKVLDDPRFSNFHHDMDFGKDGLLADLDFRPETGGVHQESVVAEISYNGQVLRHWDFVDIISAYMISEGDDPSGFVRTDLDWFHMNAATYDPSDDSLIVSSRENFLIKIDYATGTIKWIFGDPTKYWYTFPSLRAKALTLTNDGLYPIGQHAVSLTPDGQVMVFNNGFGSLNNTPGGETRSYSAVSTYRIDPITYAAQETWNFDYGRTIYSPVCSSAYHSSDMSTLVTYASADNLASARLVGLDPNKNVVFDFKYTSPGGCATAFYAVPISFEALNIQ